MQTQRVDRDAEAKPAAAFAHGGLGGLLPKRHGGAVGHHVVKTLKSEILELTQEVLANSAPKAAFKLVEIMESKKPIVQANNKLAAAQNLLDRVGVGKIDKVDINHNVNTGGIFLMPDKAPIELDEGQYEELLD